MNFRKFDLSTKNKYCEFYRQLPPYSDFSFNNLMVWLDQNDDLEYAVVNNNFVFRFSNALDHGKKTYTVIGTSKADETIEKIFNTICQDDSSQALKMVPRCFIDSLSDERKNDLDIAEEVDNRDYIFDVADTHIAKGKKYEHLRRRLRYFSSHYSDGVIIKPIDLAVYKDQKALINGMHSWHSTRSITANDKLRIEGSAIDRYLRLSTSLDAKCIAVFIDGQMEAFSIFHIPPQDGYAIGNHIKCNYNYRYIFELTYYCTISALYDLGIKLVNGEQDLGIPGIRQHKKEMSPVGYLERFSISPA